MKTALSLVLCAAFAVSAAAAELPGQTVYDSTRCAMCHGKAGQGNPAMAKVFKVEPAQLDLTSAATAAKSDAQLNSVITKGQGKMPAYGGKLKPADIEALTAYIRSLAPANPK